MNNKIMILFFFVISISILVGCKNKQPESITGLELIGIENMSVEQEILLNEEIGDEILGTLQSHFLDYGFYPKKLSELKPQYLTKVPLSISNGEFSYFKGDIFSDKSLIYFNLCFKVTKAVNLSCCYDQPIENSAVDVGWECGPTIVE